MLAIEDVLAEAKRNSLTRDNPLLADLPPFFTSFRDHQRIAIREILTAYEEGAECVVLDAPTGSGKSLVGEAVRRLLPGTRQSTYICSSKSLQDQFLRDYPYAKVLKGRSNYATVSYPQRFGGKDGLSCADCTKTPGDAESCLWCPSVAECPYERAKADALRASLAVLNTSYYLSECNGPGRFSRGGLVIADEADTLESELMSHVEVRISERRLKQYGLGTPRFVTKEESWREWAEEAHQVIRAKRPRPSGDTIKDIRADKRHTALLDKVRGLKEGLENGDWVYTGTKSEVAFKPIKVDQLGPAKFWAHGDKFLLMSATVISADELLDSLGFEGDWRLVRVASTFQSENRQVVVAPIANMVYREQETEWPKLAKGVIDIINRHPDDRILVHSVSYQLTEYLRSAIVDSQRDSKIPSEIPSVGIGVLGVDGGKASERVRGTQGRENDKRRVDLAESLRSQGIPSGVQRGNTGGLRSGSPLSSEMVCEPEASRGSNATGQQTPGEGERNGVLERTPVPPGQSVRVQGQAAMQNLSSHQRPIISYTQSSGKEQALERYLASSNSVMIAPSMDRGVDLPGDACRVQVLCKVPFLNLKDKQVQARRYSKNGSLWYNIQAIRTIVQACGRGVRSEDDHCITYLLDAQFTSNLWASSKRLFPIWWREGLVWKMKGL